MKTVLIVLVMLVVAGPQLLRAQDPEHPDHIRSQHPVMSPEVLKRRAELLGYTEVQVQEVARVDSSAVDRGRIVTRVRASRGGVPIVLEVDRLSGSMKEVSARAPATPDSTR
jgi:hypothetical protein